MENEILYQAKVIYVLQCPNNFWHELNFIVINTKALHVGSTIIQSKNTQICVFFVFLFCFCFESDIEYLNGLFEKKGKYN